MNEQFLLNRRHCVVVEVENCFLMDVDSEVSLGSVRGTLLFIFFTVEMPSDLENQTVGYADDFPMLKKIEGCHREAIVLSHQRFRENR